jgi:pantoate--beta-alanine ligase
LGALHGGHLALLRAARSQCDAVVATLFVNPTQFGPGEDFATYPRDEPGDLAQFEREGVDLAFVPPLEEMYPEGFAATVEPGPLAAILEGASRPSHFAGVATVVAKLFNLTSPNLAYFGQKDWQQTRVVQRLIDDLNFPVRMVVVGTVREPDGLALSSRNAGLSPPARSAAGCLWRGLQAARSAWELGERAVAPLVECLAAPVRSEPLADLDYAAVRDALSLDVKEPAAEPAALLVAARVGGVRLIDNLVFGGTLVDLDPPAPV